MTIEDAIKHCEQVAAGETEQGKCPECAADHKQLAGWLRELVDLRAQQTPLDRSRWEGCHYCDDQETVMELDWIYGLDHILHDYKFCPMCGRPLTEEAWAELERRLR